MKPTKEEIEKFIDYCDYLFLRKPFVNKENDLHIYNELSGCKWNYFHCSKNHKKCFFLYQIINLIVMN